LGILVLG
jgi:hypothetical protein